MVRIKGAVNKVRKLGVLKQQSQSKVCSEEAFSGDFGSDNKETDTVDCWKSKREDDEEVPELLINEAEKQRSLSKRSESSTACGSITTLAPKKKRSLFEIVDDLAKTELTQLREKVASLQQDVHEKILQIQQDKKLLGYKDRTYAMTRAKQHVESSKFHNRIQEHQKRLQNAKEENERLTIIVSSRNKELSRMEENLQFKVRTETVKNIRRIRDIIKSPNVTTRTMLEELHKLECDETNKLADESRDLLPDETLSEEAMALEVLQLKREIQEKTDSHTELTLKLQLAESRVIAVSEKHEELTKQLAATVPLNEILIIKDSIEQVRHQKNMLAASVKGILTEGVVNDFEDFIVREIDQRESQIMLMCEAAQSICSRLEEEIAEYRETLSEKEGILRTIKSKIEEAIPQEFTAGHRDNNGFITVDALATIISSSFLSLKQLTIDYDQVKDIAKTQTEQLEITRSELDQCKKQLQEEKIRMVEKAKSHARLATEAAALKSQVSVLSEELVITKEKLTIKEELCDSLQEQVEDVDKALKHRLDVIKKDLSSCKSLILELREAKTKLLSRLVESEESVLELKKKLSSSHSIELPEDDEGRKEVMSRLVSSLCQSLPVLLKTESLLGFSQDVVNKIGHSLSELGFESPKTQLTRNQSVLCNLLVPIAYDDLVFLLVTISATISAAHIGSPMLGYKWKQRFVEIKGRKKTEIQKLAQLLRLEYEHASSMKNSSLVLTALSKIESLNEVMSIQSTDHHDFIADHTSLKGRKGITYAVSTPPTIITAMQEHLNIIPNARCGLPLPRSVSASVNKKKIINPPSQWVGSETEPLVSLTAPVFKGDLRSSTKIKSPQIYKKIFATDNDVSHVDDIKQSHHQKGGYLNSLTVDYRGAPVSSTYESSSDIKLIVPSVAKKQQHTEASRSALVTPVTLTVPECYLPVSHKKSVVLSHRPVSPVSEQYHYLSGSAAVTSSDSIPYQPLAGTSLPLVTRPELGNVS